MATLANSTNLCKLCSQVFPIDMFYRTKGRFGRVYASNQCKPCQSARMQQQRKIALKDPSEVERRRLWRKEHKRKVRREQGCRTREQVATDKEARLSAQELKRLERITHSNEPNAHVKRWRSVIGARMRSRAKQATPRGALDGRMKTAISKALKGTKGGRQWEHLVGYSVCDLTLHLEKQFTKGMSWSNIGQWHVDHRIPRAAFNYQSTDDDAFKQCWSLTNLQPLWARDNIIKSDSTPFLV